MSTRDLPPQLVTEMTRLFERHARQAEKAASFKVIDLFDEWVTSLREVQDVDVVRGRKGAARSCRHYLTMPMCRFEDDDAPAAFGDLKWAEITEAHMQEWRRALEAHTSKRTKMPLATGTIYQIRLNVQSAFSYHVKHSKKITHNPLRGIAEWPKGAKRKGYFTQAEFERFLSHCPPVMAAMWRVSMTCGGLRRDEIRLLEKDQVDKNDRILLARNKGSDEPKRVLINPDIYPLILRWMDISPGKYVFANPKDPAGGPVSRATLKWWTMRARKASGIVLFGGEMPTMHHTRHSFILNGLRAGIAPAHLAEQVGHSSSKTIEGNYGRTRGRENEEALRTRLAAAAGDPASAADRLRCQLCQRPADSLEALIACLKSHETSQN